MIIKTITLCCVNFKNGRGRCETVPCHLGLPPTVHCLDRRDSLIEGDIGRRTMANEALLGSRTSNRTGLKYRTTFRLHVRSGGCGVVATGTSRTDRRENQGGGCRFVGQDTRVAVPRETKAISCARNYIRRHCKVQCIVCPCSDRSRCYAGDYPCIPWR